MAISWEPRYGDRWYPPTETGPASGDRTTTPGCADVPGTHVPLGTLIDAIRGLGAPETVDAVRRHLSTCTRCVRTAARLGRVADLVRADADAAPPVDVVNSAIALFKSGQLGHGTAGGPPQTPMPRRRHLSRPDPARG